jgi:hypothetical protein
MTGDLAKNELPSRWNRHTVPGEAIDLTITELGVDSPTGVTVLVYQRVVRTRLGPKATLDCSLKYVSLELDLRRHVAGSSIGGYNLRWTFSWHERGHE